MRSQAGPQGPAATIVLLHKTPTRQGSLRDSAALRVLARLTAPLDVSGRSGGGQKQS